MADYDYESLPTYVGNMIEEAVNSTMKCLHYSGSVSSGFEGSDGSGNPIKISPLGGRYEGSTFTPGGQATDGITGDPVVFNIPGNQGWPFHDLPSMQSYYSDTISALFQSWYSLPDPAAFDNAVTQTRQGTQMISYSPSLASPGPNCKPFGANEELGHISTMSEKFATFRGPAMDTFLDSYANKLPFVLGNQAAVAFMLWTAVAGEQRIWQLARASIAEIAGKGVEAMKAADQSSGGGADLGALLSIVGAVALIAAPFTDGLSLAGGAAVEGAAEAGSGLVTGLNAIGVVLQTSSEFVKEPEKPETEQLGSSNPVGVVDNVAKAIQKLNQQITGEETHVSSGMNGLSGVILDGHFDMSNPAFVTDDTSSDFGSHAELKTELSDVSWVAEAVIRGEVVPVISGSSKALSSAEGSGPWSRPGDIGSGAVGPYFAWQSVLDLLSNQIQDSATQLERVADVLDVIVRDFNKTDDQVHTDLSNLTSRLDQQRIDAYGGGGH